MVGEEEVTESVPALRVENAGLKGHRGWVFRDVSFDAHAGSVTTVTGPAGTGRSTLLLACAGRLKLTAGSGGGPTRAHRTRHVVGGGEGPREGGAAGAQQR